MNIICRPKSIICVVRPKCLNIVGGPIKSRIMVLDWGVVHTHTDITVYTNKSCPFLYSILTVWKWTRLLGRPVFLFNAQVAVQ